MSGGVLGMKDPAFRMPTLPSKGIPAVFSVEGCSPGNEFLDGLGSFFKNGSNGLFIAEASPGINGVSNVLFDAVILVPQPIWEDSGYSSLGPCRIGIERIVLGDQGHGAMLSSPDSKGEPGNAAAYDEEIRCHAREYPSALKAGRTSRLLSYWLSEG